MKQKDQAKERTRATAPFNRQPDTPRVAVPFRYPALRLPLPLPAARWRLSTLHSRTHAPPSSVSRLSCPSVRLFTAAASERHCVLCILLFVDENDRGLSVRPCPCTVSVCVPLTISISVSVDTLPGAAPMSVTAFCRVFFFSFHSLSFVLSFIHFPLSSVSLALSLSTLLSAGSLFASARSTAFPFSAASVPLEVEGCFFS